MSYEWHERHTVVAPNVTLVTSEDDFREVVKEFDNYPSPWLSAGMNGKTHTYYWKDKIICIVVIDGAGVFDRLDQSAVIGLLIHEGVHVWQELRKSIGEHSPSAEFEAYSIQCITQRLVEDYSKQRNAHFNFGATEAPRVTKPAPKKKAQRKR